ncbi:MAG: hypothetical protein FWG65_00780 [Turicibacter sp.]|nr:hypothetical protein [Turicibacter sp.]
MDKNISLCIAMKNSSDMSIIRRIADVVDGKFEPYQFGKQTVYHPPSRIPATGTINLWEWTRRFNEEDGKDWDESDIYKGSWRWMEYVNLDGATNLDDLLLALSNGVDVDFANDHDYLLGFPQNDDYICVFCTSDNFVKKPHASVLADNVYKSTRISEQSFTTNSKYTIIN